MSATLDAAPMAAYLGGARRAALRRPPVSARNRVYAALGGAAWSSRWPALWSAWPAAGLAGHVLVFLPGAAEIRRAQTACAALAAPARLAVAGAARRSVARRTGSRGGAQRPPQSHFLHQRGRKLHHHRRRRAVIDSGVARVAEPFAVVGTAGPARWRASARRRPTSAPAAPGEPGRAAPSGSIRWRISSAARRTIRPKSRAPIWRPSALLLDAMGAAQSPLEWLDAPPAAPSSTPQRCWRTWRTAPALAREMARYPLHPRLSRLIVEARRRGVAEDGCTVAALLSAGERLPARAGARHALRSAGADGIPVGAAHRADGAAGAPPGRTRRGSARRR